MKLAEIRGEINAKAAVVGAFDGVHLGHVALLRAHLNNAQRRSLRSIAITFEPPPSLFFNPHFHFLLTTREEKEELLKAQGIEEVFFLDFSSVVNTEPEDFIKQELISRDIKLVTVGEGFRFGRKRRGDINLLKQAENLEVTALPKECMEDEPISATRIRELLLLGHVHRANMLLGYEYRLSGEITKGLGRAGVVLETPTFNLTPRNIHKLVPPDGVYTVRYGRQRYPGVSYIGASPTFGDSTHKIEVHILDGLPPETEPIIHFVARQRPDIKFSSIEALKVQVAKDVEEARRLLSHS